MASFRFVHAADLHLDSPLRSLALRDPELAELIGTATRRALVRIVDLCLEEQVDALMIAGDLYDGDQTSMKTARFLAEQLHRLDEAGIRTFVIRGNHDAESRITRELVLPERVTVFRGKAAAIAIERARGALPIVVHGLSFADPQAPQSLIDRYRPVTEDAANIGLMHTSLGGAQGHNPYAPCSPAALKATGHVYWALGHIHKRVVESGSATLVMAGIPQGRDIGEDGPKSVSLVTIGEDRSVRIEERVTSVAQFERVRIDATDLAAWRDLVRSIEAGLQAARAAAVSPHLVVRLDLVGDTPLAWRMRRDTAELKTEADILAARIGACWIDKLDVAARPPATRTAAGDVIGELRRLIEDDVLSSPAFRAEAATLVEELRKKLPASCSAAIEGNDATRFEAALDRLTREGSDYVLARLRGTEHVDA